MKAALALFAALLVCLPAQARSNAARHEFAKTHTCPSTGKNRLPCHGYVIDHITPLCAGGADQPSNMQWQEYQASLRKDAQERKLCARLR